ncbi:MAG TPA: deaminase [Terriglobia bacterium]|nr:deaminase [Terriglobia bacterium]
MNYHRKDIAEFLETTFQATQARLGEEHRRDLRESQSEAWRTHNAAAVLPTKADSYIRHIKALTVARAQTISDAYTAFGESSGEAGEKDLTNYYNSVLSAQRSAFQGESELVCRRTGISGSQIPGLLRKFETDSHAALLEGRSILVKQRAVFRNPPAVPAGAAWSGLEGDDRRFALMAIEEALKSDPEDDRPHPKVGAVVVKDGKVLGTAHRGEHPKPKSHAEYIALEEKLPDDLVAGATVYTTLEPCTTRKHPKIPCAQRLIERKVARVVIGMLDPNPDIRGLGDQLLSDAGIEIQLFPRDLREQVEEMNREFIRIQQERQKHRGNAGEEPDQPSVTEGLGMGLDLDVQRQLQNIDAELEAYDAIYRPLGVGARDSRPLPTEGIQEKIALLQAKKARLLAAFKETIKRRIEFAA